MTSNATQMWHDGHALTQIHPESRNAVEVNTGWQSMRDYHKAVFIIQVGAIAAGGLVDAKLMEAQDEFGTGAQDISGKAITTLTGDDDDKMCLIELDTSEMDTADMYDYILASISCGGAVACLTSGLLIRYQPRFAAVGVATIEEIVE